MADTVRADVLIDGGKNAVVYCTNASDGTGEAAVVKVDVSALDGAPSTVKIMKVRGACTGMSVDLFFDATANDLALTLPADQPIDLDFSDMGGLQNPGSSGVTGDILATTLGHTAGDAYAFVIEVEKS